tara:strand:+ start:16 stop:570 length:555 start_codon:yes stop_codon:yes gene_type:complete
MYKILYVTILLSISFSNINFKNEAFKYSIQNFESQKSLYSFKLIKSQESFEYSFCWAPTKKLLINTKLINSSLDNDNKFFYNANAGIIVLKNNIFSIGINSLRFDNMYNSKKWNNYSFTNEFNFYNWCINTTLAYHFNQDFSFSNVSIFLYKNIHKNFDTGFGINISKFSDIITNIYFGIKYTL